MARVAAVREASLDTSWLLQIRQVRVAILAFDKQLEAYAG